VIAHDNEKLLIDSRTGRLLYAPEGRSLGDRVVGRKMVGGEDFAVLPEEYDAVGEAAIGKGHTPIEARALERGVVGTLGNYGDSALILGQPAT